MTSFKNGSGITPRPSFYAYKKEFTESGISFIMHIMVEVNQEKVRIEVEGTNGYTDSGSCSGRHAMKEEIEKRTEKARQSAGVDLSKPRKPSEPILADLESLGFEDDPDTPMSPY
jgi:hypothetical protein